MKLTKKTIKELKSENVKLEHELSDVREKVELRAENNERKFIRIDSRNKIISQQYKTLEEFNFQLYVVSVKKFEAKIERHKKYCQIYRRVFWKQLSQKSYAEKLPQYVPTRATESINNKKVSCANTCIPSKVVTRSTKTTIKTMNLLK